MGRSLMTFRGPWQLVSTGLLMGIDAAPFKSRGVADPYMSTAEIILAAE